MQLEVWFKSMTKELDIAEVARLSDVTPSTLRFYEKKGLIAPVGRNGLRRQYNEEVLNKLQLIALGQAAGFSLEMMAGMVNTAGRTLLDRERLIEQAKEIDRTIRRLQLISRGLKHVARCPEPNHTQCEGFKKVVAKGLRLLG